jgi:hypothetical protein
LLIRMKSEVQVLPGHHPASDQRKRGPASELSRLLLISSESTRVGHLQEPHCPLTSTFAGHWAHFRDASLCCTAVVQRITSRADVDAAKRAARIAGCPGRRCQRDGTEPDALWSAASAATPRKSGKGRRGSSLVEAEAVSDRGRLPATGDSQLGEDP